MKPCEEASLRFWRKRIGRSASRDWVHAKYSGLNEGLVERGSGEHATGLRKPSPSPWTPRSVPSIVKKMCNQAKRAHGVPMMCENGKSELDCGNPGVFPGDGVRHSRTGLAPRNRNPQADGAGWPTRRAPEPSARPRMHGLRWAARRRLHENCVGYSKDPQTTSLQTSHTERDRVVRWLSRNPSSPSTHRDCPDP